MVNFGLRVTLGQFVVRKSLWLYFGSWGHFGSISGSGSLWVHFVSGDHFGSITALEVTLGPFWVGYDFLTRQFFNTKIV